MPTVRKYATNADRQAAYRARRRADARAAPPPPPPPVPGSRRWAALVRQAHGLLAGVAEEMTAYGAERSDAWHNAERGERFAEQLAALEEILDLLQDQTC